MFCPKCGSENENDYKYCARCGAELIDNQPTMASGDFAKTQLVVSPKTKKVFAVVVVAVVALIVFSAMGSAITNPKNIAERYFKAVTDSDWEKVYGCLALQESEFINEEQFAALMERESNNRSDILNFEIKEDSDGVSDGKGKLLKTYTVKYTMADSTSLKEQRIALIKQAKKKLLFFDDYGVSIEGITASSYRIFALNGSTVYVDDIMIPGESSSELSAEVFIIDKIFSGLHELRIENSVCVPYSEQIRINSGDADGNEYYEVPALRLTKDVKSELARKTEVIARRLIGGMVTDADFDSLTEDFTSNDEALNDIRDWYYEAILEKYHRNDGTGIASADITWIADISTQSRIDSSGQYVCEMEYKVDFVQIEKRWNGDRDELTNTSHSSSDGYLEFVFFYERDRWVFHSINHFYY